MILNRLKYLLPPFTIALVIFVLSHQPNISLPQIGFVFTDKILHSLIYFVFGYAVLFSFYAISPNISKMRLFVLLIIIGTGYAVSDEFHQTFIPGREFEFADIIADIIGVVLSFFLYPYISLILIKHKRTNV